MCLLLTLKFFWKDQPCEDQKPEDAPQAGVDETYPWTLVSQCLLWSGARQRRKSGTDTQIVYITKMLCFKKVLSVQKLHEIDVWSYFFRSLKKAPKRYRCRNYLYQVLRPSEWTNGCRIFKRWHKVSIYVKYLEFAIVMLGISLWRSAWRRHAAILGILFAYIDMAGCLHSYIK